MSADFAPDLNYGTSGIGNFRFWCQKTLPLVYDDSLSYYELLCKLTKFMQDAVEDISTLDKAYLELQDYVNHYFDSLDVQEAINAKLDEMVEDGTLGNLVSQYITRNNDVVIITASYGDPSVIGSGASTPTFLTMCKSAIETNSGMKCYCGYKSGASFSGYLPSNDPYAERITYMPAINMALTNIASEGGDASTVGQVIIVGGGNDVWVYEDETRISNGMRDVCARLKSEFPNAIIRFAWASWRLTALTSTYDRYNKTITLFKKLCGRNGIGYCHNSEFIFHQYNPDWYKAGDNLHPSILGSQYFADGIVECILTGSCDCVKEEYFNVDDDNNPFLTRPESSPSDFHYQFTHLTDFVVRQHNENTYIIPGRSQYNPSCKLDSGFMGAFDRNARNMLPQVFATVNSKLIKCVGNYAQYGGFPVNIFVVNSDNTICNTVNALGKFLTDYVVPPGSSSGTHVPSLWLTAVMDSTYYPCGTGGETRIYLPEVVLPTAYC